MTAMIIYDNKGLLSNSINSLESREELLKCVMHFQVFCGTIFFREKTKVPFLFAERM